MSKKGIHDSRQSSYCHSVKTCFNGKLWSFLILVGLDFLLLTEDVVDQALKSQCLVKY